MGRVILRGYIVVPRADLARVAGELPEHVRLTRAEPGCVSFSVEPSEQDPQRFDVAEEFIDRAAFEAHQDRVRSSVWGQVTLNVARHYEVTEAD
ncbi:MAG: antibiotic biosynthesis monooxygenase [Pseudomonadota bacterium]